MPPGATLNLDLSEAASGRVGITVNSLNPYAPGTRNVAIVTLQVAQFADIGLSPVTFGNTPTPQSVVDGSNQQLLVSYQSGNIQIGPANVGVSVSGRVFTPEGLALRNAIVSLIDEQGIRRIATTSSFGIFQFENVAVGQTYLITVSSKRYRYAPQFVNVVQTVSNLELFGLE